MKESHLRSIIKALSWRIFGTLMTAGITYFITHKVSFAIYVGLFEFFSKLVFFYLHERIWNTIPFGKASIAEPAQEEISAAELLSPLA